MRISLPVGSRGCILC